MTLPTHFPELVQASADAGHWVLIAPNGMVWSVPDLDDVVRVVAALKPVSCPIEGRTLADFHAMPLDRI